MDNNPIILLHPVRKPLDQTALGALELLARIVRDQVRDNLDYAFEDLGEQ